MDNRELVCIGCPMGCSLSAEIYEDGNIKITGNTCKIGETYGIKECTNPTRTITSTVEIIGGEMKMLPIKTEKDIQKDKIQECMKALAGVKVKVPVKIGDVIIENIAGTGVNIIATKNVY